MHIFYAVAELWWKLAKALGLRFLLPRHPGLDDFARPNRMSAPKDGLESLFYAHDGREIHKWGHYPAIYERYIGAFVARLRQADPARPARLLEIGVAQGGSLELWRKYLGPDAVIFGIDVNVACAQLNGPAAQVRIGSQADPDFLRKVVTEMGGIDIVIDDGSHRSRHQRIAFDTLFPLLAAPGLYIAEDLHASYWPGKFRGGRRRPGTFIEIAKSLVDDLHGWYHNGRRGVANAPETIDAIHFHDSIVVIEKAARERPFHIKLGTRTI